MTTQGAGTLTTGNAERFIAQIAGDIRPDHIGIETDQILITLAAMGIVASEATGSGVSAPAGALNVKGVVGETFIA